jgi:hypothetical protein
LSEFSQATFDTLDWDALAAWSQLAAVLPVSSEASQRFAASVASLTLVTSCARTNDADNAAASIRIEAITFIYPPDRFENTTLPMLDQKSTLCFNHLGILTASSSVILTAEPAQSYRRRETGMPEYRPCG